MKASLINKFAVDRRGTTLIAFGLAIPALLAIVGGSVDYARYIDAKSQTKAALDASVMAGARTLAETGDNAKAIATAQAFYQQNIEGRLTLASEAINFQVQGNNAVVAKGQAAIETTFLKIIGIGEMDLSPTAGSAFSRAEIRSGGGSDLEVSVMLDLTGSMCDDGMGPCATSTKLDALKTAATKLVNTVVSDDQSKFKSRVALVPFAQRVRVAENGQGATLMNKLTNMPTTWSGWTNVCTEWNQLSAGDGTEGSIQWECTNETLQQVSNWNIKPCVTERFYENGWYMGLTDEEPGSGAWLNATDGRRNPTSMDSAETPMTTGTGATSSDPATHYNYDEIGDCWSPQQNVLVPLSSDKAELTNAISAFQAEGETGGALGTAFAWYVLSPKWKSIWNGQSKPAPYSELTDIQPSGAPKLRKVAILMSDGVYNTYRSWGGQDQQMVSDYAKQLCTNMKAEGIEVYAIGFDLDSLPASERTIAEDTLKSCGTSIDHFYDSLNAQQLEEAFQDIASSLSSVVLTE